MILLPVLLAEIRAFTIAIVPATVFPANRGSHTTQMRRLRKLAQPFDLND